MNLDAFLSSPAGIAAQGMLAAAFLDFAFGVYAAAKDGSFSLDAVGAFIRKHLLGRVFPIATLLGVGYVTGDLAMNASAAAAAVAYSAETLGSIYGSLKPPAESVAKVDSAVAAGNPIPQD
jgi:hypothetical protein